MREHQIVITLKPDQFLEIQRLARAANAKSMGIFVRQHLLAALGIEGTAAPGGAVAPGQAKDIKEALQQIKRLHGELTAFVAESVSLYNIEPQVQPAAQAGLEQTQAAKAAFAQPLDSLENVAERTFAISPRLGAITNETQAGSQPSAASTTAPADAAKRETPRLHHPHAAASDLMDVPYKAEDASTSQVADPLHKLLPGENEFKPIAARVAQQGGVGGDVFGETPLPQEAQIPLSLAERNRQLRSDGGFYVDESAPQQSNASSAPPDFDSVAELESGTYSSSDQAEISPATQAETGSAGGSTPNKDQANINPSTGKPLGYSSFSGSPPPKRRQV